MASEPLPTVDPIPDALHRLGQALDLQGAVLRDFFLSSSRLSDAVRQAADEIKPVSLPPPQSAARGWW
jgi:hypothetical protein